MSIKLTPLGLVNLGAPYAPWQNIGRVTCRSASGKAQKQISNTRVDIKLGLERTHALLKDVDLSWRAVHVAGTNGKGTTCLYMDAMLRAAGIRTGRFLSPHLFDRWDGININDRPVAKETFLELEDKVRWRNDKGNIHASPFEILTVTAFEIFNRERIEIGVVECGMGGLLDATNVIRDPLVTIITSINRDHTAFLGETMQKIATHKAGIMKSGRPCIISPYNLTPSTDKGARDHTVANTLIDAGRRVGADVHWTNYVSGNRTDESAKVSLRKAGLDKYSYSPETLRDMLLAATAFRESVADLKKMGLGPPDMDAKEAWPATRRFTEAMTRVALPGRYQKISIENLTGRKAPILLDGAHNPAAWAQLASRVGREYGRQRQSENALTSGEPSESHPRVTWVVGMGQTPDKSPDAMMQSLWKRKKHDQDKGDAMIAVEFGPVDGMPWVVPLPSKMFGSAGAESYGKDILGALKRATDVAKEGPLVITGSLYLVADVLRLLRDHGTSPDIIWRRSG